jgi:VanZ family protein
VNLALRATAPLALMALIFYLSAQESIPGDPTELEHVIGHFTEYAVLAALWAWALAPALGRRALLAAATISLLYAITDEFHQSFVEGRKADPLDVLVDACGIAVALVLVRPGRRLTQSRGSAPSPPRTPAR